MFQCGLVSVLMSCTGLDVILVRPGNVVFDSYGIDDQSSLRGCF